MPTPTVPNLIANRPITPDTASARPVINPATGETLAQVEMESTRSAEQAVQAAAEAFPKWSATPVGDRCQFFFKYKQVLEAHFEELASSIVREHGKTKAE